jgi:predicted ArsR family transcriptional regulator
VSRVPLPVIPESGTKFPANRDEFLRSLVRELSGTLQDVVGLTEASGFVSLVGQRIGEQIDQSYRSRFGAERLTPAQVAAVLVDLKAQIQGNFSVEQLDDDQIVLSNSACPFGDKVHDRPALCMMTSNVFGVITAENLGYAKVVLHETIAEGDGHCRVVVHLRQSPAADATHGREYFQS